MAVDRAALVEKVADLVRFNHDPIAIANEAIDLIRTDTLAEAAGVAEAKAEVWATEWRKGMKCDSHLEGKSDGADDVAAAIRALANQD